MASLAQRPWPREVRSLLRCPRCGRPLELDDAAATCAAAHSYPVVGGVPRLVEEVWGERHQPLVAATGRAFGDQWTRLADGAVVGLDDLALHLPQNLDLTAFQGLVLDAGCGMGRYTGLVADLGATVLGLDLSEAVIEAARRSPQASFVQGDLAAAPLAPATFDVVFSFGVLHHLPDPELGLRACWRLVRPGGLLLVWVYAEHGGLLRRARIVTRRLIARRPALTRPVAAAAAGALWLALVVPAAVRGRAPARLPFYGGKGLGQLYVDCHDALAAPLERYLRRDECEAWLERLDPRHGGVEPRRDGSGWLVWARRGGGGAGG